LQRQPSAPNGTPGPPLAHYASVAHVARVYDYLLGGKDNITHAVPAVPHSGHTQIVQARQMHYSKIVVFTVRDLACTCMCTYVRFAEWGLLTLS
jgi:hypothetical protein